MKDCDWTFFDTILAMLFGISLAACVVSTTLPLGYFGIAPAWFVFLPCIFLGGVLLFALTLAVANKRANTCKLLDRPLR